MISSEYFIHDCKDNFTEPFHQIYENILKEVISDENLQKILELSLTTSEFITAAVFIETLSAPYFNNLLD